MFVSCHSRERLLPQAQPFTGARTTQAHGAESVESWQPRKATKMTLLDPKTEEKLLDTARADLVETEARIATAQAKLHKDVGHRRQLLSLISILTGTLNPLQKAKRGRPPKFL